MKRFTITFLTSISVFLIFVVNQLTPLRVYSHFENRYLSIAPTLSFELVLNNRFSLDYEEYVNDQFVGRDYWITLKAIIESSMFKQENNGIYFGKDGYLFDKMIDYHEQLTKNEKYMNEFLQKYQNYRISIVMPLSSYMVYQDKLPKHAPFIDQYQWLTKQKASWPIIDVHDVMLQSKKQVYYRNDHHWTLDGAYLAYEQFIKHVGYQPKQLNKNDVEVVDGFLGTYYAKGKPLQAQHDQLHFINPPILSYQIGQQRFTSLIDQSAFQSFDKYRGFLYGNHGFATITTREVQQPNRLLVIKDSFANSLIPLLVDHYDVIDVVDLRSFSGSIASIIEQHDYQNILFLHSFDQFSSDTSIAKLRY